MEIVNYLEQAVAAHASDLFIIAGSTVSIKLDRRLQSICQERLLPPKTKSLITEIYTLAERSMDTYLQQGDDDFAIYLSEWLGTDHAVLTAPNKTVAKALISAT